MAKLRHILDPLQQAEHLRNCTLKSFTVKYFLGVFLAGPSVREQGKGCSWPSSIPYWPRVWPVLSSPGCGWVRGFQVVQGWVAFPGCVFMAHWHSFPQVWWCQGEVMAAAWQEGGERGEWFGLLHSPSARGAVPKCRYAGLGGEHCGLFLVCEPGTAPVLEGTSFGLERTGRQFLHGCFPFHHPVPSGTRTPVLLSQYQL